MYTYIYTYMCTCMYMCTYINKFICWAMQFYRVPYHICLKKLQFSANVHVYLFTYVYIYKWIYTYIYTHTYIRYLLSHLSENPQNYRTNVISEKKKCETWEWEIYICWAIWFCHNSRHIEVVMLLCLLFFFPVCLVPNVE